MSEITFKPGGATSGPVLGLIWGCVVFGGFGAFVLGTAAGGAAGDRVIAAWVLGILGSLGAAGWAVQIGQRAKVSVIARLVLALGSILGGFLIGLAGRAGEDLRGSAQLEAWFGQGTARAGLVLLLVSILTAVVISLPRFRPPLTEGDAGSGSPESAP